MTIWEAVLLGLAQGLTEFLPISSSGHLVLGKAVLGIHTHGVAYEVFVHFGTFFAVLTVFWADVAAMLEAVGRAARRPGPPAWRHLYQQDMAFRTLVLVLIATVPAAVVGLVFESDIEVAFESPAVVSFLLLCTGLILMGTRWAHGSDGRFGWLRALLVGAAQAVAILPGISRSGSTIAVAQYLGIERSEAARFSFLLALPAIFGAAALEALELAHGPLGRGEILPLTAGFVMAYASGVMALRWLLTVVRRGRLDRFAYYCFALGTMGLVWAIVYR
ncbi:MAG: undecaprenyl-diphosphate phosphatase [candidate division KSB1 bacterium]|nr:undecaprenyl-diphosphate phosphatase [candidate division KSB1 bacterium]